MCHRVGRGRNVVIHHRHSRHVAQQGDCSIRAGCVWIVRGRIVARGRSGHQAAVEPPVEPAPDAFHELAAGKLVLDVGCFIQLFVVIDAEGIISGSLGDPAGSSRSGNLRRIKARGHRRPDHIGAEVMVLGNLQIYRIAGYFRAMPVDGEGNGRVAQHAEVEGVVRVLPDVLAAENDSLAKSLLESGVKLIAETGAHVSGYAWAAIEQRIQHSVRASAAGEHQVLIEWRLHGAGIGDAQNGSRRFDVVRNAGAWLRLASIRQAVINVLAKPQVEQPVTRLDLVFDIESKFLDVGMPVEKVIRSPAGQVIGRQDGQIVGVRYDWVSAQVGAAAVSGRCKSRQRDARYAIDAGRVIS